jgi:hypothetical protein
MAEQQRTEGQKNFIEYSDATYNKLVTPGTVFHVGTSIYQVEALNDAELEKKKFVVH